jgi:uncharacterized protein (TIGR00106 family)
MIVHFTLTPLGTKTSSLSKTLSKAMSHVVKSGLPYKVGPMGTTVQGSWEEIMGLIDRCRKTLLKDCPRVTIQIAVDDRKGAADPIREKVRSLEKKMGRALSQ